MKRCLRYLLLLLIISPLLLQVSCKKDGSKDKEEKVDEIVGEVLDGTSFGFLLLPNVTISENIAMAKIKDKEVKLVKTEDQKVGLFLPDLPDGSYALTYNDQSWKIKVKNQKTADAAATIDPIFELVDQKFELLLELEDFEAKELDQMIAFKAEVMKLYNGLTAAQKKEVAQYYLANRSQIQALTTSSFVSDDVTKKTELLAANGGGTKLMTAKDPGCGMHTTFAAYYDCQCATQAAAYQRMAPQLGTALRMLAAAGSMAGLTLSLSALGPAALGIAAVGISLPLATAMYILIVDIGPDIKTWLIATRRIIKSPWIMRDDLFDKAKSAFNNEEALNMNVQLGYRTLRASDGAIVPNGSQFLGVYQSATTLWNKISALVGNLPSFGTTQNITALKDNELIISDISNNSVQLIRQNKGVVTFKSINNQDHDFSFVATVNAEGFTKQKTISAKIMGRDSIEIYKASVAGTYQVMNYKGNSPNATLFVDLLPGGKVTYRIYNDTSWPNGATFSASWSVVKLDGKYYYSETGFWHYGFGAIEKDFPLKYPVSSFRFHNETTYSKN